MRIDLTRGQAVAVLALLDDVLENDEPQGDYPYLASTAETIDRKLNPEKSADETRRNLLVIARMTPAAVSS